ncbi:MAG: peptidoglycan DD-metalloendopeptidase family protein [Thermoflexales bacterium]
MPRQRNDTHTPKAAQSGRRQHASGPTRFFALLLLLGLALLVVSIALRFDAGPAQPAPDERPTPSFQPLLLPPAPTPSGDLVIREYAPSSGSNTAIGKSAEARSLRTYTVVEGDTVFGIALKFGLRPETILWSNYDVLKDNFDLIRVGQQFIIPPEDGMVIEVEQGDTIEGIARRYQIKPERIVEEPINGLRDINQPLQIGQVLFLPGGQRETVVWQVPKPVEVRRTAKGVRVYRVGKCGEVAIPPLGSGSFIYPTKRQYLSGYDFGRYHPGLDFAGRLGEPIYASDGGTVIYAGYSLNAAGVPVGYGQYVVLDHGNGYQTLYAHASQLYVSCGQQVAQGAVIAAIGSVGRSTGPHLHFEIRYKGMAVNPWTLLPPRRR